MIAPATWPRDRAGAGAAPLDRSRRGPPRRRARRRPRAHPRPRRSRSSSTTRRRCPRRSGACATTARPSRCGSLAHAARRSDALAGGPLRRGDWRQRTEDRPPPPRLAPGERVRVAGGAIAQVLALDAAIAAPRDASPSRATRVRATASEAMWRAIYAEGRPVQYAYVEGPLALWHVQSSFAARPWAVESPSAGRPLTFALLERLRRRGVGVAPLTHAAGLSSTGDAGARRRAAPRRALRHPGVHRASHRRRARPRRSRRRGGHHGRARARRVRGRPWWGARGG